MSRKHQTDAEMLKGTLDMMILRTLVPETHTGTPSRK